MSDDRYLTLADLADALCDPAQHVERIPYWDANRNRKHHVHKVTMPGLLQQMADLMLPGGNPDAGPGKPGSRPPGNWAALADHSLITAEVTRWCWDMRIDIRGTVESNVRQLVGHSMDGDTRQRFEKDLRRWHRVAQHVTGWRSPPAEVRAPCPALTERDGIAQECGRRTLRVAYQEAAAYCSSCGTTWDRDTVGLLAETVRAYNAASAADATVARARARAERANKEGAAA